MYSTHSRNRCILTKRFASAIKIFIIFSVACDVIVSFFFLTLLMLPILLPYSRSEVILSLRQCLTCVHNKIQFFSVQHNYGASDFLAGVLYRFLCVFFDFFLCRLFLFYSMLRNWSETVDGVVYVTHCTFHHVTLKHIYVDSNFYYSMNFIVYSLACIDKKVIHIAHTQWIVPCCCKNSTWIKFLRWFFLLIQHRKLLLFFFLHLFFGLVIDNSSYAASRYYTDSNFLGFFVYRCVVGILCGIQ